MLSSFRKHASGPFIKVLMGLLVLTFVLWGVGDLIRKHNRYVAFQVADREFSDFEWSKLFSQHLKKIEENFNHKFTKEEIKSYKLDEVVLNQIINDLVLQQEAYNEGILISDDMVKYEIASLPYFQKDGKFDKTSFDMVLRNMQVSEAEFIANIKENMAQNFLGFAMTSNRDMPPFYTNLLLRARNAMKDIAVIHLPLSTPLGDIKQPTEETLKSIYNAKIEQFTTHEKRDVSYLTFNLSNISVDGNFSEEELNQQFEEKKFMFTVPEKRKTYQIHFKNEEDAKKALAQLKNGEDFTKVGKQYEPEKNDFSMGEITAVGIEKDVADAIFNARANSVTDVVRSSLGYHIFRIDNITPAKKLSFAEAKDRLKTTLLEERKFEALTKLAQEIDMQISSGKKLAEIAQEHTLKIEKLGELTQKSQATMMNVESFKNTVFSTLEDSVSSVTPLSGQDSYFVLQIDKVFPKLVKDFEQAKPELEAIWNQNKAMYVLGDKAETILNNYNQNKPSLNSFNDIQKFCKDNGLPEPITVKFGQEAPKDMAQPIEFFNATNQLKKGEISVPVFNDKAGYYLGIVYKVEIPVNVENTSAAVADVYNNVPTEIIEQLFSKLRTKHKVVINHHIIERVVD